MGKITSLKTSGRKNRVNVFIDGTFSFTVDGELAARAGLRVGRELSASEVEELRQADLFQGCFRAALHYLGYRPRSEAEVKQRLHRRGFAADVVDSVIAELKKRNLIDDMAFAQYWRDNRLSFKPRSQRLIKLELWQKGVSAETSAQIVEGLDDETIAYEAGRRKARAMVGLDYDEFRHRLFGYLQRRGFGYEVVSSVVSRLWEEKGA
ncbi:MAG TPA: regulatory protein RecX [Dehalococcoidia bacterium]|nr:regulatory protein RecX [Dehalococcoidia bacterium]